MNPGLVRLLLVTVAILPFVFGKRITLPDSSVVTLDTAEQNGDDVILPDGQVVSVPGPPSFEEFMNSLFTAPHTENVTLPDGTITTVNVWPNNTDFVLANLPATSLKTATLPDGTKITVNLAGPEDDDGIVPDDDQIYTLLTVDDVAKMYPLLKKLRRYVIDLDVERRSKSFVRPKNPKNLYEKTISRSSYDGIGISPLSKCLAFVVTFMSDVFFNSDGALKVTDEKTLWDMWPRDPSLIPIDDLVVLNEVLWGLWHYMRYVNIDVDVEAQLTPEAIAQAELHGFNMADIKVLQVLLSKLNGLNLHYCTKFNKSVLAKKN